MKSLLVAAALTAVALAPPPAAADTPEPALRRMAYIVGANDGGAERVTLRYASTDAVKLGRVIRELGGVAPRDLRVLQSSSLDELLAGFRQLRADVAAARQGGARVELLVYYSGHSDDQGLLLGDRRLSYEQLREEIRLIPADVHIAILDSCASGAFTRVKGGTRRAAFLADESTRVEGYAFIASSSADEVAQESDRIAASFFTHYLISGLRGAADVNRDGRVTLNEAYQFAFAETVSRTEATQGGVQHPAYNLHLAGTGDIVMTDLRATSATLLVAADVHGRLFIRDRDGYLVVELMKLGGRPIELGLGPDRYDVMLQRDDGRFHATVDLRQGMRTTLSLSAFAAASAEPTVARGAGPARGYLVPVAISFVPPIESHWWYPHPIKRVSINILAGASAGIEGLEVGGLANIVTGGVRGVQVAGIANVVSDDVRAVQIAGISNVVAGDASQVQVAGIANFVGGDARGVQVAGIFNGAASIDGLQIGVVNAARRVRGLQIGVVNLSEKSDTAIGLVNLARDGRQALEVWASDFASVNAGVKLGTRRTYSILTVALGQELAYVGAGLGIHTPRDGYYLDGDVISYDVFDHDLGEVDEALGQLRLAVGWNLGEHFALFAGGALSVAVAWGDRRLSTRSVLGGGRTIDRDEYTARLTPGLFAGVATF